MGSIDHLDFLTEYRENNRIEAKRAQGGLPHSLWETYSSFANTLGGVILLGVAEAEDKSLYSVLLPDPQKLVDEFWRNVNDPTVISANILNAEDVEVLRSGGHSIVAIFVPRADFRQRPVYVGLDPFFGTYFRKGEEDCHSPRHEVEAMLGDRDDPAPLEGLSHPDFIDGTGCR
ncbi:MAG: ATP-binding protein [Lawsonibacter sp.]|nr:ATP-binding protein [Lawsonibacter sp.]